MASQLIGRFDKPHHRSVLEGLGVIQMGEVSAKGDRKVTEKGDVINFIV